MPVIQLAPNRVRRNYRGGYLLDKMEGKEFPQDGSTPEDWLASTTRAVNPGLRQIPDEGLSRVPSRNGEAKNLLELFQEFPDYYLGKAHYRQLGPHPGFLAKLLDSAIRLPMQAHPTSEFARNHLNSPWGKLEAYVILGLRNPAEGYIRLGFQNPPTPKEWRRIILEQDIVAMDACFAKVPIRVGEVWLVPGGLPHAIGEGVLMLEVMEPSDLVVRCEFERDGIYVPPEARFMQQSVDLALEIFDYTKRSIDDVTNSYRIPPQKITPHEELLIGPTQTDSFSIKRFTTADSATLPPLRSLQLGIVTHGEGILQIADHEIKLRPGIRFLIAASAPELHILVSGPCSVQIVFCSFIAQNNCLRAC